MGAAHSEHTLASNQTLKTAHESGDGIAITNIHFDADSLGKSGSLAKNANRYAMNRRHSKPSDPLTNRTDSGKTIPISSETLDNQNLIIKTNSSPLYTTNRYPPDVVAFEKKIKPRRPKQNKTASSPPRKIGKTCKTNFREMGIHCEIIRPHTGSEQAHKFIQAGVGSANLQDRETNTIQPIFPTTIQPPSERVYGQQMWAFDEGKSNVLRAGESVHIEERSMTEESLNPKLRWRGLEGSSPAAKGDFMPCREACCRPCRGATPDPRLFNPTRCGCQTDWASYQMATRRATSKSTKKSPSPQMQRRISSSKVAPAQPRKSSKGSPRISKRNIVSKKPSRSPKKTKELKKSSPEIPNLRKFRFFVKENEELNKMLTDPEDRRIRTICERFQCDLDVYAKNLIGGFMQYTVDIAAPNKLNLMGCVKNLDSALGWQIASQLTYNNARKHDCKAQTVL